MPKTNEINTMKDIPINMPRRNNFMARKVGSFIIKLMGWKILGPIPDLSKLIVIGAPHTSIWDFFIAVPVIMAFDIKATIMMKKEAFFWPMSGLWRRLGFIPIDRKAPNGIVSSIVSHIKTDSNIWVVLTPEGTRSKAKEWKTGFLNIANNSNIPVLLLAWDYPTKTIHFGPLFTPTGNNELDLLEIQKWYKPFRGKKPENQ